MSSPFKSRPRRVRTGDHLTSECELVITMTGTDQPYMIVKPGYNPGIGPHVSFYRVLIDGDHEHCFTLRSGGVSSLLRWLPLVMTAARRQRLKSRREKHPG